MVGNKWRLLECSEKILLLFCRAQDQASMQLSEMEEEMDQRIHVAERRTRDQVGDTQTQVYKTHSNTKRRFLLSLFQISQVPFCFAGVCVDKAIRRACLFSSSLMSNKQSNISFKLQARLLIRWIAQLCASGMLNSTEIKSAGACWDGWVWSYVLIMNHKFFDVWKLTEDPGGIRFHSIYLQFPKPCACIRSVLSPCVYKLM